MSPSFICFHRSHLSFYCYGNSSTSLKPFFFPAVFQDCFEFLVITLSSLNAQIKKKHASRNSLMETQLQSLIFIYRPLETKQNPEYYFIFSLVFFWEISLSCKIKQTFQGCIFIYFRIVTPGNKKICLSFAQQFRFINRTKCNCSFYFSRRKKEMCNGKPWFFFFFCLCVSVLVTTSDWFLWICCTLEWRVWIWNNNHFAQSHP